MAYKFNIFTGNFDLVNPTQDLVARVGNTTDNFIPRWVGTNQDKIDSSKSSIQDGGGIQAQAFLFHRNIQDTVIIPSEYSMIATDVVIDGGEIVINQDSELVII